MKEGEKWREGKEQKGDVEGRGSWELVSRAWGAVKAGTELWEWAWPLSGPHIDAPGHAQLPSPVSFDSGKNHSTPSMVRFSSWGLLGCLNPSYFLLGSEVGWAPMFPSLTVTELQDMVSPEWRGLSSEAEGCFGCPTQHLMSPEEARWHCTLWVCRYRPVPRGVGVGVGRWECVSVSSASRLLRGSPSHTSQSVSRQL